MMSSSLSKWWILIFLLLCLLFFWLSRYFFSPWLPRNDLEFSWNYQSFEQLSWTIFSSDKLTVLSFYAPRCPSCRKTHLNILSQTSAIPSGLQILNVDYDNSKDLRKKYWVTTQHTFVLIDNEWNMIKKWNWLDTLDDIIKFVQ